MFFVPLLFAHIVSESHPPSKYQPLELDDKTFEQALMKSPLNFVMATMDNVSFCEKVYPIFLEVGEKMKENCQFIILNEKSSKNVRHNYKIFAYPSFYVFRYANYSTEYTEERDVRHFTEFISRLSKDPVRELKTARDVHDFLEKSDLAVILAGDHIEDNILSPFNEVANNMSDYISFAIASSADAVQQLNLEELPSLRLHRKQDRKFFDYPLAFNLAETDLRNWILTNRVPRYSMWNSVTFRDLAYDPRPTILSFVDTTSKKSLETVHSVLDNLVDEFGNNFTYVYADFYEVGELILSLGFSGVRDPYFCIAEIKNGFKNPKLFNEKITVTPKAVANWVKENMKAYEVPQIESEEPLENQTGPLFKLVASEYEEKVFNRNYDVVTIILNGTEEKMNEAYDAFQICAIEFKKQRMNLIRFYSYNMTANTHPSFAKAGIVEPMVLYAPKDIKKKPFLVFMNYEIGKLMENIMNNTRTGKGFKIPVKYDEGSLEL